MMIRNLSIMMIAISTDRKTILIMVIVIIITMISRQIKMIRIMI